MAPASAPAPYSDSFASWSAEMEPPALSRACLGLEDSVQDHICWAESPPLGRGCQRFFGLVARRDRAACDPASLSFLAFLSLNSSAGSSQDGAGFCGSYSGALASGHPE